MWVEFCNGRCKNNNLYNSGYLRNVGKQKKNARIYFKYCTLSCLKYNFANDVFNYYYCIHTLLLIIFIITKICTMKFKIKGFVLKLSFHLRGIAYIVTISGGKTNATFKISHFYILSKKSWYKSTFSLALYLHNIWG